MMQDPTQVADGIEVSPDDQTMTARRGAYLVSVAQRTGGWQNRSPVLARGCPFHAVLEDSSAPATADPA